MNLSDGIPYFTRLWNPTGAAQAHWKKTMEAITPRIRAEHGRDPTPYEGILKCFSDAPFAHPLKEQFLILCWQHQWPEELALERDGVLNHWAIRMAAGLCRFPRLVMMGCASSSKTALTSAYCYTAWKAKPFNSSVFLSTTSAEAGQNRNWGAVKNWHRIDKYRVGERVESMQIITLDKEMMEAAEDGSQERDLRNGIKCVNIKPGVEGKNVVAAICGRKNGMVIWHADEYSHMDMGILEARINLNSNTLVYNQFIGTCNAPGEQSVAHIDATPFGEKYPDGWRSIDKDTDFIWDTERGKCLYFNGADSPNMRALAMGKKKPPFPFLMHEDVRASMEKDSGGVDTPGYWTQFYGFPPQVDISDKVFSMKLLEKGRAFDKAVWHDSAKVMLAGLDLGFRVDGDPCVLHFGTIGQGRMESEGDEGKWRKVLECEPDGIPLMPSQKSKESFEEQMAQRVVAECRKRGCAHLALDVTGDGGILLQHIERVARAESYVLNVIPVSFSGLAEERVVIPDQRKTGREMFANMVAQLWGSGRVSVLNGNVCGLSAHGKCVSQLCSRKMMTDDKKRMAVEPKREMKKRLRRSPDQGDAWCLLIYLALRHSLAGMAAPVAKPKPFNPEEILRKSVVGSSGGKYQVQQRQVYGGR